MVKCDVCQAGELINAISTREMMFGMRHQFTYAECTNCGVLSLVDPPAVISSYYPSNYYAYNHERTGQSRIRQFIRGKRLAQRFGKRNVVGAIFSFRPAQSRHAWWFPLLGLRLNDAVLDIGCGFGAMLRELSQMGYSNLTGLDPFNAKSVRVNRRLKILNDSLESHNGSYDIITLEHSFEHMPDPNKVMLHLERLLKPRGRIMIRIPLSDSLAREKYEGNWVQLDAPRHFHLHTRRSMSILAASVGFEIYDVVCDSDPFQFRSSELYRRDIPLIDHEVSNHFSNEEEVEFRKLTHEVNSSGRGDQAAFFLRRC